MKIIAVNGIKEPVGMSVQHVHAVGGWFVVRYGNESGLVDIYLNNDSKECFRVFLPVLRNPQPGTFWSSLRKRLAMAFYS